jgi:hypothetical protein
VTRTPENAVGDGAKPIGLLTAHMKRVLEEQRLGFVATVCPDGTQGGSRRTTDRPPALRAYLLGAVADATHCHLWPVDRQVGRRL